MPKKVPPRLTDYPAHVAITTRWSDNDIYGHVNNVVYYAWFDTAVNQYLIEQGALDIHTGPIVGLVVESLCSYFDSASFPDSITAGLRVAHIGNSSVKYEIGLFKNDNQSACAAGYFVHVYVDRNTRKPVVLPKKYLTVLTTLYGQ